MGRFDADVVILGGGCAGLSLAARLSLLAEGPRVRVVEARDRYTNDRTWSFWADAEHEHRSLVSAEWPAWTFSRGAETVVHRPAEAISYQMIAADDFYAWALATIDRSELATIDLATVVTGVEELDDGVLVSTVNGPVRSRWVVDTRPPGLDAGGYAQRFAGAEIETTDAVFDPTIAGLMTDMTVDEHGFRFTYLLPFDSRHALVEETRFGRRGDPTDLQAGLDRTVRALAPDGQVRVLRTERGVIPMQRRPGAAVGSRVVRAGTAGGAVRPSTGYAFQRIQRWSADCAAHLAIGRPPIPHPAEPAWRAAADALFLQVLDRRPETAPTLFMALARGTSPDRLTRFLSDAGGPRDFAGVVAALPKAPFLAELPRAVAPTRR